MPHIGSTNIVIFDMTTVLEGRGWRLFRGGWS
jgi:hypothetical protein